MTLARKIILHSPVSNENLLEGFVERCLAEGVSLLAIFGQGSEELEDKIDWIIVGDGSDPRRFLCTSSHPDESFDDVLNMAQAWDRELGGSVQEVRL
jgi:hypothetical protein